MKRRFLVTALLLVMIHQSLHGIGALFTRPLNSSSNYQKAWIKSLDATVQINGQVAETHTDQTFLNEMNQTVETIWIFPLPEGAVVTELYFWFNGKRYKADIREAAEARQDYEDHIRQRIDPALLEYLGDNLFKLSIAPVNPNSEVRTEMTYIELLPYEFGTIGYTFLMDAAGLSPKPLNRFSVNITVETQSPIKTFSSPSHATSTATQITKVNDRKYTVVYGDENVLPDKDLRIEFETVRGDVDVNMLRYTPVPADSIGDDSYYAVWITPPDSIAEDEVIPRKIVFCADVSSSMEGLRIEQLKEALLAFLDNLNADDHFNIVTFGTTVMPYKTDLISATPGEITAAKEFVRNLGALGLTDINSAMLQSLGQSFSEGSANMIFFITDGYPTWGVTFIPDILQNIRTANTKGVRIFPFGVGDVSKSLLVQMGDQNGGYATFIQADDSISVMVQNHLTRIAKPVLTDLAIEINGLATSEKFPRVLPDLFWGSQVMQLGMYSNSGTFPVKLTGNVRGEPKQFQADAEFSLSPGGYRFVPWLWASAKIDYLLDQITMYGEQAELKNQVIELSLRFQILTPYTSFYSDPTDPDDPGNQNTIAHETAPPSGFRLNPCHPNPFNAETLIRFDLASAAVVHIAVYDIQGRLIRVLLEDSRPAGSHSVKWDGKDSSGMAMPSGIYICKIQIRLPDGRMVSESVKMGLVR
jgi:Ca-activated chloride channel family protein